MLNNFENDMSKAAKYTKTLYPTFKKILNAKTIRTLEGFDKGTIEYIFDTKCGIDLICITKEGVRSIGMRIQYDVEYCTFTIRLSRRSGAKTELRKRLDSIRNGYIYPYYTCQCYFNDSEEKLISGAMCKTVDLYRYTMENEKTLKEKIKKCPEGNYFYPVLFSQIRKKYEIYDIYKEFKKTQEVFIPN